MYTGCKILCLHKRVAEIFPPGESLLVDSIIHRISKQSEPRANDHLKFQGLLWAPIYTSDGWHGIHVSSCF